MSSLLLWKQSLKFQIHFHKSRMRQTRPKSLLVLWVEMPVLKRMPSLRNWPWSVATDTPPPAAPWSPSWPRPTLRPRNPTRKKKNAMLLKTCRHLCHYQCRQPWPRRPQQPLFIGKIWSVLSVWFWTSFTSLAQLVTWLAGPLNSFLAILKVFLIVSMVYKSISIIKSVEWIKVENWSMTWH